MKMKKLNRKGFTLIELLAVIVILAIVMGVAANAVLNVMNDSRKNTLQSSAKSAADAFRTAYAETELRNTDVILGIPKDTLEGGAPVKLVAKGENNTIKHNAFKPLGISTENYDEDNSYVIYQNGGFMVCLTAKKGGSYYLSKAATKKSKDMNPPSSGTGTAEFTGNVEIMWACSDDTNSWS